GPKIPVFQRRLHAARARVRTRLLHRRWRCASWSLAEAGSVQASASCCQQASQPSVEKVIRNQQGHECASANSWSAGRGRKVTLFQGWTFAVSTEKKHVGSILRA